MKEFQECATCAVKPGSPILCESCLNNRSAISSLNRAVALSEERVKIQTLLIKENNKPLVLEAYPDPKNHFLVSMIKSSIRIVGYLLLLGFAGPSWLTITAVGVLVVSEAIGIIEELV